ncbi:MAG: 23S rRNA (guanosine(2251)-2'-O)-methyltransferase RlmB [Myxococcaceae bacterium]|nr:23S rRNA (guanosine(2251)-2'-O)-methyltransferase RlmB [Myxococcaceae bacterium]
MTETQLRGANEGPRGFGDDRYVFGVNPVLELLRARPRQIDRISLQQQGLKESVAGEIFSRAREHGIRVDSLERERLDAMAPRGAHQGVVAEVRQFDYATLDDVLAAPAGHGRAGLVVVLDGIQDPMNLGAIVRSAHAFGADGVIIAKDRAAAVTGVVAKAAAGATAHTKIARVTNLARALEALKEKGYWSVAADPGGDQPLWSARLDGPLAVVIGAEGGGVRKGLLEHCDFRVRIPMVGQVASLNASVSAGVLLAEVARRRATGGAVS